MSTPSRTKIFGITLAVDPKILIGSLLAFAAVLFWFESRGDDSRASTSRPVAVSSNPSFAAGENKSRRVQRRRSSGNEQNKLELKLIDITRADIDPTLRLDLLARLQGMPEPAKIRNVFEVVKPPEMAAKPVIQGPIIDPDPVPVAAPEPPPPISPPFTIALKYCGFYKPADAGKNRKGFFLDGDNVLIGSEGDILDHRYRIVGLTTASAELEDVEVKKGQTLSLVAKVNP